MIHNYIFDFGNVLARFSPEDMTAEYVHDVDTAKIVCEVVFDRLYWDKLDNGSIADDEVKAGIRSRLPMELHQSACAIYEHWVELLPLIDGMRDLVLDIKNRGGKLFLLSNISIGFAEIYEKNPAVSELLAYFDGLVFSGPLGLVKPSREIFDHLLNSYDLKAEECLFIDDSPLNTVGAQAVGIRSYCFDGDVQKLTTMLAGINDN